MPVKQFLCPQCNSKFEKLCKTEETTAECPHCGETSKIEYNGKCNAYKSGGCGGNCKCCGGCKH